MFDLLKKTMLTGVGLAAMTKDRVEELARDIAKSAQMSGEKGEEFVNEAVARAEKAREDLETTVQHMVNDALKRMNAPTRDDLNRLEAQIRTLEQRIEAHAAKPGHEQAAE